MLPAWCLALFGAAVAQSYPPLSDAPSGTSVIQEFEGEAAWKLNFHKKNSHFEPPKCRFGLDKMFLFNWVIFGFQFNFQGCMEIELFADSNLRFCVEVSKLFP